MLLETIVQFGELGGSGLPTSQSAVEQLLLIDDPLLCYLAADADGYKDHKI